MEAAMLARRLARLEARQPARPDALPPDLQHLPADLAARIMAAQETGTFPQSLTGADLRTLLAYIGEHGERIGEQGAA